MCFTDAAFRRTAWGSRPNVEVAPRPAALRGAGVLGAAAAAAGMAAVAGFSCRTIGMADVEGPGVVEAGAAARAASTTGMAAVAGSGGTDFAARVSAGSITARAARSRSAARAAARVVGIAAVAGSGVVLSVPATCPLGWARRRPVGLVRSRSSCARRVLSMVGDMVVPLNACEVSCRVRTRPSGRWLRLHPKGLRRKQARRTVGPPSLPRVWRILDCGRARRQSRSGPAEIRVALRPYSSRKVKSH